MVSAASRKFGAIFELSRLSSSSEVSNLIFTMGYAGDEPTQSEFRDLVLAYKADALRSLNILNDNVMQAFASLAKVFTPLLVDEITNTSGLEWNISYYQGQVEYYEYLKSLNPGYSYYEQQFTYYKGRLAECQAELNKINAPGYKTGLRDKYNAYIDRAVADYKNVRTAAIAILNALDANLINAFYNGVAVDSKPDAAVIALGKALYAGVAVSGGVNEAFVKRVALDAWKTFDKYYEAGDEAYMNEDIAEFFAAITYLNGLSLTDTIPQKKLNENYVLKDLYDSLRNTW